MCGDNVYAYCIRSGHFKTVLESLHPKISESLKLWVMAEQTYFGYCRKEQYNASILYLGMVLNTNQWIEFLPSRILNSVMQTQDAFEEDTNSINNRTFVKCALQLYDCC